jgi:hypothetical protein
MFEFPQASQAHECKLTIATANENKLLRKVQEYEGQKPKMLTYPSGVNIFPTMFEDSEISVFSVVELCEALTAAAENLESCVIIGAPKTPGKHPRDGGHYDPSQVSILVLDFDCPGQPNNPETMHKMLLPALASSGCVVQRTSSHGVHGARYRFWFLMDAPVTADDCKAVAVAHGSKPPTKADTTIYQSNRVIFIAAPADATGSELEIDGPRFEILPGTDFVRSIDLPKASTMPAIQFEPTNIQSITPDEEILRRCRAAANGSKFDRLASGDLIDKESQSHADAALIQMLWFWTKDRAQIMRIFRSMPIGQRAKAQRDNYLNLTIDMAERNEPVTPAVDYSALLNQPSKPSQTSKKYEPIPYPPGMAGDLARYIERNSIRPIREVGIVAALGIGAGICGRAFNVSNAGLNLYMLFIAGTGRGKEGIADGISSVFSQLSLHPRLTKPGIPSMDSRRGPAAFSSGAAVVRHLTKSPCFISVFGEFGYQLAAMTAANAKEHNVSLKGVLTDAYSKSGHNKIMCPRVYADSEKNAASVRSPALSFIAESSPKILFSCLSDAHIADGFLPRIIVIQYSGEREYMNENPPKNMDQYLQSQLIDMTENAMLIESTNNVCHVAMTDEAREMFRALDRKTTDAINGGGDDVGDEINNRAHLNSMKIAALLACFDAPLEPCIDAEHAQWSIDFIRRCGVEFWREYTQGTNGAPDYSREISLVKKCIVEYEKMTPDKRRTGKAPLKICNDGKVIPMSFLRHKILRREEFRTLPGRGKRHLDDIISDMIEQGILQRVANYPDLPPTVSIVSRGDNFGDC